MRRRLATLALVSLVLLAVFSSQVWFKVSTSVSPALEFTGAEVDSAVSSILILVGLTTLVALYMKTRVASVLHLLSLVLTVFLIATLGTRLATSDLTSVETRIEKATGVAGWLTQRQEVISQVEVSLWPSAALVASITLTATLVLLALLSLRRVDGSAGGTKKIDSKNPPSTPDLWSETSQQL